MALPDSTRRHVRISEGLPTGPIPDPAPRARRLRRVLFVDDEPAILRLAERSLRRAGFEISGFACGATALRFFEADPHAVDLLVTDYSIPGCTGCELATALRALRPELPVLIISGYEDVPTRSDLVPGAPCTFLRKPFTFPQLAQAALEALESIGPRETPARPTAG